MDKLTPEQRKKNMRSIKGKDTSIEMILRKALYNISKVVSKISRPTKGRLLCYSIFGGNFG